MESEKGGGRLAAIVMFLIGLVAGFLIAKYLPLGRPPAEQLFGVGQPKVREVVFGVAEGKVNVEHQPILLSVGRKDTAVWRCDRCGDFTVTLNHQEAVDPEAGQPPDNPFAEGGPPVWKSQNGRLQLGPAIQAAFGHQYKFTIKIEPNGPTYDPHIIFER